MRIRYIERENTEFAYIATDEISNEVFLDQLGWKKILLENRLKNT